MAELAILMIYEDKHTLEIVEKKKYKAKTYQILDQDIQLNKFINLNKLTIKLMYTPHRLLLIPLLRQVKADPLLCLILILIRIVTQGQT